MSFNLDEYVDVAERIHSFYERFEDGRLVTVDYGKMELGGKEFVFCHAKAFRSADDPLPGDGVAWEPVPGPTQFTRDSELMNAQTAAWGRAIVALGFETKKLASRQEVQARTSAAVPPAVGARSTRSGDSAPAPTPVKEASAPAAGQTPQDSPFAPPPGAAGDGNGFAASRADAPVETAHTDAWKNVTVHWSKNKGKTLGELAEAQRRFYAEKWAADPERVTPVDRALRRAARMSLGLHPVIENDGPFAEAATGGGGGNDDDIPFARTFA